jgi:hypothetical protein
VAAYLCSISKLRKGLHQVNDLPEDSNYFDKNSNEGKVIFSCLEKGFEKAKRNKRRTRLLEITITDTKRPDVDNRFEHFYIPDNKARLVNDMVKDLMIMKLNTYVSDRKAKGCLEKHSIQAWLRFYGLDDRVLTFETAKKWLFRTRKILERYETQGVQNI